MTSDLIRFTQWARESPQRQYTALMGMLCDPEGLNASFERQPANKAPGGDGVRKAEPGGCSTPATSADYPSPLSHTAVDDSGWEPDGVTLHVRFYEGGGTYQATGIPAATLKISPPVEVALQGRFSVPNLYPRR